MYRACRNLRPDLSVRVSLVRRDTELYKDPIPVHVREVVSLVPLKASRDGSTEGASSAWSAGAGGSTQTCDGSGQRNRQTTQGAFPCGAGGGKSGL